MERRGSGQIIQRLFQGWRLTKSLALLGCVLLLGWTEDLKGTELAVSLLVVGMLFLPLGYGLLLRRQQVRLQGMDCLCRDWLGRRYDFHLGEIQSVEWNGGWCTLLNGDGSVLCAVGRRSPQLLQLLNAAAEQCGRAGIPGEYVVRPGRKHRWSALVLLAAALSFSLLMGIGFALAPEYDPDSLIIFAVLCACLILGGVYGISQAFGTRLAVKGQKLDCCRRGVFRRQLDWEEVTGLRMRGKKLLIMDGRGRVVISLPGDCRGMFTLLRDGAGRGVYLEE